MLNVLKHLQSLTKGVTFSKPLSLHRIHLTHLVCRLIVRAFHRVTWLGDQMIWEDPTQSVGEPLTLDLALDRYKQGKCPCCGKSRGETKGLEYRTRSNDLYCHTCKKRWPVELNLGDLQRELQISLQSVPDFQSRRVFELDPHCNTSGIRTEKSGLRRLIKRVVLRRW